MMTKLIRLSFLWHFINNGVNCAPKPAALTCTPSQATPNNINNVVYTSIGIVSITITPQIPFTSSSMVTISLSKGWTNDVPITPPRTIRGTPDVICTFASAVNIYTYLSQSYSSQCTISATSTPSLTIFDCTATLTSQAIITCVNLQTPTSCGPSPFGDITVDVTTGIQPLQECVQQISNWVPNLVDFSQAGCTFKATDTAPITPNSPYTGHIQFQISSPLIKSDQIQLVFSGMALPASFSSPTPTSTISMGFVNGNSVGNLNIKYTITNSNTVLTITLVGPTMISPGSQIFIEFTYLQSGPSIKPQTLASVTTFRGTASTNNMIDTSTQTLSYSCTPGAITLVSVTAVGMIINTYATYYFTIQIQNGLLKDGYFLIQFPSSTIFGTLSCSCTQIDGTTVIASTSCTLLGGQVVKVLLGSTTAFTYVNQNFILAVIINYKFKIQNVRNPLQTDQSAVFSMIQTKYSNSAGSDYLVDQFLSPSYTVFPFLPGVIKVYPIALDNYVVGQVTNILFNFTIPDALPVGGQIIITIPQETQFMVPNQDPKCQLNGTSNTCTMALSNNGLTLTITLSLSSPIAQGTNLGLKLLNCFRNPYSTAPTNNGQFSIQTTRSDSGLIDQALLFGQINANVSSSILNIQFTRPSVIGFHNGDFASYTFNFMFSTPQINGAYLIITTPNLNIAASAALSCTTTSQILNNNLICSQTSVGVIQITLQCQSTTTCPNNYIQITNPISITINQIQNPFSYYPSAAFGFKTQTQDNYQISQYQGPPDITVINTYPGAISQAKITPDVGILFEQDSLSFTFNVQNQPIPPLSNYFFTVYVSVPSSFGIPSSTSIVCSSITGFNGAPSCTTTSDTITITPSSNGLIQQGNYGFKIGQLLDPKSPSGNIAFQITTYQVVAGSNYMMDQSQSGFIFTTSCTLPCRTCPANQITTCSTCYTNAQVSSQKYYFPSLHTCKDSCGPGYYSNDATLTCLACSTNCASCDQNLVCITCYSNFYLYQNSCLNQCPIGTFQVGSTSCQNCNPSCTACSGNANTCTSCSGQSTFLYQSSCISTCPDKLFAINNTCITCAAPCLICSSGPTVCAGCDPSSSLFLLQGQKCVAACDNGFYPALSKCQPCVSPCDSCSTQTQCISCLQTSTKPFLLQTTCYSTCPPLYTPNGVNCIQCSDGCSSCNSTSCLTCSANYFSLGSSCAKTCPTGYDTYIANSSCVQKAIINNTNAIINNTNATVASSTNSSSTPVPIPSPIASSSQSIITSNTNTSAAVVQQPNSSNNTQNQAIVQDNLQQYKYIPFPYLIMLFFVSLSVVIGKLHRQETFVAAGILGLGGILVYGSWITLLYLYLHQNALDWQAQLLIAAIVANYLLNIVNMIYIKLRFSPDPEYKKWLSSSTSHKVASIIIYTISLLGTFMVSRVIISKFFGFKFFKAKLTDTSYLNAFNVINGVCILICCVPACISSVTMAYYDKIIDQLFISALDALIVTLLIIIFLVMDTQKEENYFEDTDTLYHSLNQTNKVSKGEEFFSSNKIQHKKQGNHKDEDEENKIGQSNQIENMDPKTNKHTMYFEPTKKNEIDPNQKTPNNEFHDNKIVVQDDDNEIEDNYTSIQVGDKHKAEQSTQNQKNAEPESKDQKILINSKVNPINMGKRDLIKSSQINNIDPDDEPNYPSSEKNKTKKNPINDDNLLPFDNELNEAQQHENDHSLLSILEENSTPKKVESKDKQKLIDKKSLAVETLNNNPNANDIDVVPKDQQNTQIQQKSNSQQNTQVQQLGMSVENIDNQGIGNTEQPISKNKGVILEQDKNNQKIKQQSDQNDIIPIKQSENHDHNHKNEQEEQGQQLGSEQEKTIEKGSGDNLNPNHEQVKIDQSPNQESNKVDQPSDYQSNTDNLILEDESASSIDEHEQESFTKQDEQNSRINDQSGSQDDSDQNQEQQIMDSSNQSSADDSASLMKSKPKQLSIQKQDIQNGKRDPKIKTSDIKKQNKDFKSQSKDRQNIRGSQPKINQQIDLNQNARYKNIKNQGFLDQNQRQISSNVSNQVKGQNLPQKGQDQNKFDSQGDMGRKSQDSNRSGNRAKNQNQKAQDRGRNDFQGGKKSQNSHMSENSQNQNVNGREKARSPANQNQQALDRLKKDFQGQRSQDSYITDDQRKSQNQKVIGRKQDRSPRNPQNDGKSQNNDPRNARSQDQALKGQKKSAKQKGFFEDQPVQQGFMAPQNDNSSSPYVPDQKSRSPKQLRQNNSVDGQQRKWQDTDPQMVSVNSQITDNNNRVKTMNNRNRVPQIRDVNESLHTLSDPDWGENQLSPSDFNALNQRYDEDFQQISNQQRPPKKFGQNQDFSQGSYNPPKNIKKNNGVAKSQQIGVVLQKKTQSPDGINQQVQDNSTLSNGNYEQQGSMFDEFSKNYNQNQNTGGRLKEVEKIYLQRLENNKTKKRIDPKGAKGKDTSDALYIDENFDENDIVF